MDAVIPSGNYYSAGTILADTSETVVLGCATGFVKMVTNLNAAMDDGSASTLRLVLYRAPPSAMAFTVFHDKVIPANDALDHEFMPLVLQAGDELRATGAAGTHVIVTFVSVS